jgi:hypothetical protein
VLLASPRDQPLEPFPAEDLQGEGSRVALANVLDEVDEEMRIRARLRDLPRLEPEIEAAAGPARGLTSITLPELSISPGARA